MILSQKMMKEYNHPLQFVFPAMQGLETIRSQMPLCEQPIFLTIAYAILFNPGIASSTRG